jgi:hypothetical protein
MRGVPEPRRTSAEKVTCALKGRPSPWKFPVLRHRIVSPGTPRGRENGEAGAVNRIAATRLRIASKDRPIPGRPGESETTPAGFMDSSTLEGTTGSADSTSPTTP